MRKTLAILCLVTGLLMFILSAVNAAAAYAQQPAPTQASRTSKLDKDGDGSVSAFDFTVYLVENSMALALLFAGAWMYRRDLKAGIVGTQAENKMLREIIEEHAKATAEHAVAVTQLADAVRHLRSQNPGECPITNPDCPFNRPPAK